MTDRWEQVAKAEAFGRMHSGGRLLVLPNAWDVVSARLLARRPGCRALGTTSAGVAAVAGYPDGEWIPPALMIDAVGRIASAVGLPVTADLEAGYAATAEGVAEHVGEALTAGAVGVNLEDADGTAGPGVLWPLPAAVERVAAARQAADRLGIPAVVNARTDVFLAAVGDPDDRLEHAVTRLAAYRDAGADSLFVPGISDAAVIEVLVTRLGAPLNLLAATTLPTIAELERLGVARLSVGSGLHRAVLRHLEALADDLLTGGGQQWLGAAIPYAELQDLLGPHEARG